MDLTCCALQSLCCPELCGPEMKIGAAATRGPTCVITDDPLGGYKDGSRSGEADPVCTFFITPPGASHVQDMCTSVWPRPPSSFFYWSSYLTSISEIYHYMLVKLEIVCCIKTVPFFSKC